MGIKAKSSLELDQIIFIPAHQNPLKSKIPVLSDNQRLRLLSKSIQGYDGFLVSLFEVERNEPSYTIDTLKAIISDNPINPPLLFLLLGADQVANIDKWRSYKEILNLTQPVIFTRPGSGIENISESCPTLTSEETAKLTKYIIDLKIPISATTIRKALAKGNFEQVQEFIPKAIHKELVEMFTTTPPS
jgi:nicotinate-nucleotide adenylyltransferase